MHKKMLPLFLAISCYVQAEGESQNSTDHFNEAEYRKAIAAKFQAATQKKEQERQDKEERVRLAYCEELQKGLKLLIYLDELGKQGGVIKFDDGDYLSVYYSLDNKDFSLNSISWNFRGDASIEHLLYASVRWIDKNKAASI